MSASKIVRGTVSLVMCSALVAAAACAGRTRVSNNLSVGSESSFTGKGVSPLAREDYEVGDIVEGTDASTSWFVLWFPVGGIRTKDEIIDGATYDAVKSVESGCDGLLVPQVKSRRIFIPLLIVNVLIKRDTVRGRCFKVVDDEQRGIVRGTTSVHVPSADATVPEAEVEPAGDPVAEPSPGAEVE